MSKEVQIDLKLNIFKPNEGIQHIQEAATKAGLVPDSPSLKALVKAAQTKPYEYFMTSAGKKIQDRANSAIYNEIKKVYNLGDDTTPEAFWEKQWNIGKTQVENLVERFTPEDTNRLGLLNEVVFTPTPAEVIQWLHAKDSHPRSRFEQQRQLGLALISSVLENGAKNAEKILKESQKWLDIELFNKKPAETRLIFAWHNNTTNAAEWVSSADNETASHIDETTHHLKIHQQWMRHTDDEIGPVLVDGRKKKEGPNKGVKKGIRRETTNGENSIYPINDVPDMIGMQFVVEEEEYSDGERVAKLMNNVTDIFIKRLGITKDDIKEKNGSTDPHHKSGKFKAQRLMVYNLPGTELPMELMFHGQKDHLNNNYEIGTVNPETEKLNGAAHALMEVSRGIEIMQKYFPEEIYGPIDWKEIEEKNYKKTQEKLLNAHRVNPLGTDAFNPITVFNFRKR